MNAFRVLGVLVLLLIARDGTEAAQPPCPSRAAVVTVFVDNRSADEAVSVSVTGELPHPARTCDGGGDTTYAASFTCTGSGLVRCGDISGLRPGAWVHRLATTVSGSDPQQQARQKVIVADPDGSGTNRLVWTIYPRTFIVADASAASLRSALDAAAAYTASVPGSALVTFSRGAFPGAAAPQTIDLARAACAPDPLREAALCFTGSRVVVDALDASGAPGGVVWSVGYRALSVLRLYGSDDVFRGLVFKGSTASSPASQLDTVAIVGLDAQRNRLEQSLVVGPSLGDGVSVDEAAGDTDSGDGANLIDDCEITGAEDKGVKVTFGARAIVRRSCVHDNANGGIQTTLGGQTVAVENIVEHNVPGSAANGLSATGNDPSNRTSVSTTGNVIRFAGGRGMSVTDNASGYFDGDYVADNQFVGAKVETTAAGPAGAVPQTTFHGVAFVCNRNAGVSGSCQPQSGDEVIACASDADCPASLRCGGSSYPRGFGAVVGQADGQAAPAVSFGDATVPGGNAFTLNRNTALGANLHEQAPSTAVSALGNQWEHCGTGESCDTTTVVTQDVRLADGATVDIGTPPGPRAEAPVLSAVSPARPRGGELVRVYGANFNAIEGAACAGTTAPATACSAADAAVETQNRQTNANRVRILARDGTILATLFPEAVTPTMIAFHMPFDCFAPLVLQVAKRDPNDSRLATTISVCDPDGCAGQPAGVPCDDRSVCTTDDRCTGGDDGVCRGEPIACVGACLTGACDPAAGCVPKPASAACDDGDACTVRDHCSGTGNRCVSGVLCEGACLTGACDPVQGCEHRLAGTVCRAAADVCDLAETCDGSTADCPPNALAAATAICRPAAGPCDVEERCTGRTASCPADAKRADVCRPAADGCDLAERCDGVHDTCPDDAFAPDGIPCAEGDPCATGGCTAGVCVSTPLPPFEHAICALQTLIAGPLCGGDRLDDALAQVLDRRVRKSEGWVRQAKTAAPAQAARLLKRVDRSLRAIQRRAQRSVHTKRISMECGGAVRTAVGERRALVDELRS